jgi:hypothetical protein
VLAPSTPPANGALDSPLTSVLFGGTTVGTGARSGVRGQAGYWFGDCHLLGVEVGGFYLGDRTTNFNAVSMGDRFLGRPFFNPVAGRQDVELTAAQLQATVGGTAVPVFLLTGGINVHTSSKFWGYDVNLRSNWLCGPCFYVDALLGYRGLGLDESLDITETVLTNPLSTLAPAGTTTNVLSDHFAVQNRFYGAQVGLDSYWALGGRWSMGLWTKFAMGTTQQLVTISGSTITNVQGPTQVLPGGLLAQPTNSGRFSRDAFTVVPEVGVNLGYQITNNLRATLGYNFLYWSDVARPGDQVDLAVNPNQLRVPRPSPLTGPPSPALSFHSSGFWAQGLTAGIELRW